VNQKITAAALTAAVAAGMTDRQIAAKVGMSWISVRDRRLLLGLPANRSVSPARADAGRRNVGVMLAGLRRKAAGMSVDYKMDGLRPAGVAIVLVLLDGPLTVKELVVRLEEFDSGFRSNVPAGVGGTRIYYLRLLRGLIRREWVVRFRPSAGDGRKVRYMLTVSALEVIHGGQGSQERVPSDGGDGSDPGVRQYS